MSLLNRIDAELCGHLLDAHSNLSYKGYYLVGVYMNESQYLEAKEYFQRDYHEPQGLLIGYTIAEDSEVIPF